ncbi:MAG: chemotaxis protein CheA [Syntrophobacteraceae bacterium]|jgi:two-component system chemotaxis sensor kinase CheA
MIDQLREVFKSEAADLLAELEAGLLELEKKPGNRNAVGRVFRALHTLKGSSAMAGWNKIAPFAHEVESVFELVRIEQVSVTKELIDLILAAGDEIRRMLGEADTNAWDEAPSGQRTGEIVQQLKKLTASGGESEEIPSEVISIGEGPGGKTAIPFPTESPAAGEYATYRIFFRPFAEILSKGSNPVLLLNELHGLGVCNASACLDSIPLLDELNAEECHTSWDVILTTRGGFDAIRDVFIFVEDDCELKIEVVEQRMFGEDPEPRKLGEILVDRGDVVPEQIAQILDKKKLIGEMLVESGLVSKSKVQAALAEQQHVREMHDRARQEQTAATVRVPAERLDSLVDLVGELVTVQASLSRLAMHKKIPELRSIAEHVDRLTAELRDSTMSIRMLPIGTTFSKFNRLVRDLSSELGKEVILTIDGAETELDKTVIERIHDPLVHLIRNSIDHGIESPGVRASNGKPRQGTVHLSAIHSGANVLISIEDDGAGLNKEAIRKKAVENGLISPDVELSEKEVFGLIFAPGFSTAGKVTNVSGRGVGMDVVKSGVEALRGAIDIASREGAGTTITLKLPLTLAIVDGLLVKIADANFVLPLSIVEECVELTNGGGAAGHGRQVTFIRGEIVPYIRLRERFSIDGPAPPIEQIVVTETMGGRVGFVVDKVIGEHQTVIKNLGKIYSKVRGVSGATILGDGTVALIVDVPQIVQGAIALEERSVH